MAPMLDRRFASWYNASVETGDTDMTNAITIKLSDAEYRVLLALLRDTVENTAAEDVVAVLQEALPEQGLEIQHGVFWGLVDTVEAIAAE